MKKETLSPLHENSWMAFLIRDQAEGRRMNDVLIPLGLIPLRGAVFVHCLAKIAVDILKLGKVREIRSCDLCR